MAVVGGVGLLRESPRPAAFALPMLIWIFLTSAGIEGGVLIAALAGDEVALPVAVIIGALGGGAAALAVTPIVPRGRAPDRG